MEIDKELIIAVIVFLTSGVLGLWRMREKDSVYIRDLSKEVGELKGRQDGIELISEKVIAEVRSIKEEG